MYSYWRVAYWTKIFICLKAGKDNTFGWCVLWDNMDSLLNVLFLSKLWTISTNLLDQLDQHLYHNNSLNNRLFLFHGVKIMNNIEEYSFRKRRSYKHDYIFKVVQMHIPYVSFLYLTLKRNYVVVSMFKYYLFLQILLYILTRKVRYRPHMVADFCH